MNYPFLHRWDPGRYPEMYLRLGPLEAVVQKNVLVVLRQLGVLAFAVDAGAKALRGRAYGALRCAGRPDLAARLKGRTGVGEAGLSDVIGVTRGGRALFVEVKAPALYVPDGEGGLVVERSAGQPTEEQLAFLAAAHRHGAVAGVAWAGLDAAHIYNEGIRRTA